MDWLRNCRESALENYAGSKRSLRNTHSFNLDTDKSNETKKADLSSTCEAPQERAVNENQTIRGEFGYHFKSLVSVEKNQSLCVARGQYLIVLKNSSENVN